MWFAVWSTTVVTIGVGLLMALMAPSINAAQAAAAELNQKVASTYGASEVTSTKARLFITVDGNQFSCYKPSFQDVDDSKPIQCENNVVLEAKKEVAKQ